MSARRASALPVLKTPEASQGIPRCQAFETISHVNLDCYTFGFGYNRPSIRHVKRLARGFFRRRVRWGGGRSTTRLRLRP